MCAVKTIFGNKHKNNKNKYKGMLEKICAMGVRKSMV